MNESMKNDAMVELITRGSHHRHINTMTLVQNLFPPGKFSRTISLNTHYIVAFKNPRDSLGVSTLSKQAFPGEVSRVMETYEDATQQPYGYLLFDLHPTTTNPYRLRTSIFISRGTTSRLCKAYISYKYNFIESFEDVSSTE